MHDWENTRVWFLKYLGTIIVQELQMSFSKAWFDTE
ncbi:hypothetical protein KP509_23G037300 [Ceratopteris richardii]|uniref:Uncharacterized protein n=1 Tax=Ceratopteris richardii TaxID=49495 RepID=A0A8T2S171_CERRI|nr:hypothetical protein KP509_23G037300 [Ceratopteris richardii]